MGLISIAPHTLLKLYGVYGAPVFPDEGFLDLFMLIYSLTRLFFYLFINLILGSFACVVKGISKYII